MRRSFAVVAVGALVGGVLSASPPAFAGRAQGLRFHAQSQSWVSADRGWLMGTADCAQGACTTVIGPSSGGTNWQTRGTLGAPITNEDGAGVTEVVFADALHGWAYG